MVPKKDQVVSSRAPSDLVEDLRKLERVEHLDRSSAIRKLLHMGLREWKLDYVAALYRQNKVTLERSANIAGVSVWEMMDYFREKKIPLQYDQDDFDADLTLILERTEKRLSTPK